MIGLGWVARPALSQGPKTSARSVKRAESESVDSNPTQPKGET